MNYDLIRNFVTVAKTRNITRAAELLFVSQSTVSHRLHQLEQTLSQPLIHRSRGKRMAELTEQGKAFLPLAEKWLALWQETDRFRAAETDTYLRVACIHSLTTCVLREFLVDFSLRHPQVRLKLMVLDSEEICTRLSQGRLDVGITLNRLSFQTNLYRPLLSEKMYCVSTPGLLPDRVLSVQDLDPGQEILLDWGMEFSLWHDFRFPGSREPKMEVNDISLIEQALRRSACWSIVPETVAMHFQKLGICTGHSLKNPPPERVSYVATSAFPAAGIGAFLTLFQQELDAFIASRTTA